MAPERREELLKACRPELGVSHEWEPLLDEAPAQSPITIEEIEGLSTIEELKALSFKIERTPLTSFQRDVLTEALRSRCRSVGIDSWNWTVFDANRLQAATQAMQDWMTLISDSAVVSILDNEEGKPLRFRFKATQANLISGNNRIYLRHVLADAVERFNARVAAGQAPWGEEPHPPKEILDATTGLWQFKRSRDKAILRAERAFMEGDEVFVDAVAIEDTDAGRRHAADLRAGNPVFYSTRAYGGDIRTVPTTDGRQVTAPMVMDIEIWDRVDNPAIKDAAPTAILDAVQLQAILDAVQAPAHAPAPNKPNKGESAVKWSKTMVTALAASAEGRRELAGALTDASLDAEIRTAITDALASPLQAPAPAQQSVDVTQAVTDALRQRDEQARQADEERTRKRNEAATYVQEQIAALRAKGTYPKAILDGVVEELKDCADKPQAEMLFRQQMRMVDNALATVHLSGLGYHGGANGAALNIQVGENQSWRPIYDGVMKAFDDWRFQSTGERVDPELRKANAPFVQKLLKKFDALNMKGMLDAVEVWHGLTDSITTSDLYTQAIIQRALLEQAFGDADMLQFLFTDTFEGDAFRVPVEYFEAPQSVGLNTSEMASMPEAKVHTTWLSFSPTPRRVRIEISNDVQYGMRSGPLQYDTAARALYHIAALVRRTINRAAGNEMLRASDAYQAVAVNDETIQAGQITNVVDAGNVKYRIALAKDGHADAPVVRPRAYKAIATNGAISEVRENPMTVTIGGAAVTEGYLYTDISGIRWIKDAEGKNITGYAVDYEYGYLYVSDGLTVTPGATECVVSYNYATNYDTFSLTPGAGVDESDHYSKLLRKVGLNAAMMGAAPRYMAPNICIGSLTAMEYVIQASLFNKLQSPNGTVLNSATQNFVASRNGVDFAKHNTLWDAGDRRLHLCKLGSTKYGVRDPLKPNGPYPSYDSNGKVLPGQQWYSEEWSALFTPQVTDQSGNILNPCCRTIILKP